MENEGKKGPEFRIALSWKKASSLYVFCACQCVLSVCMFSSLCFILAVSFLMQATSGIDGATGIGSSSWSRNSYGFNASATYIHRADKTKRNQSISTCD